MWLGETYENFKDVDLVDEGSVVLHFLLLDGLNGELLMALTVLGKVHYTETSVRQLLLERVDLFDVSLCRVDKVLRLVARRSATVCC